MRALRLVFCMALVGLLAAVGVVSPLLPEETVSRNDNRQLQKAPVLTLGRLVRGEFFKELEDYSLDHVAGRDACIGLYYRLQEALGKRERNGFVECEDDAGRTYILSAKSVVTDEASAAEDARAVAQSWLEGWLPLRDETEAYGGRLLLLQFPHKVDYLTPVLPWYYEKRGIAETARAEAIAHNALGLRVIDASAVLEAHRGEALYFYTDNHYTELGAYYVYRELLAEARALVPGQAFTLPDWDDMLRLTLCDSVDGNYQRKLGRSGRAYIDPLVVALPEDYPASYDRLNDGQPDDTPLLDPTRTDYSAFAQANGGILSVDTHREELPDILFIGDSYANPLEVLAAYNFNRMDSIDPRYYPGDVLAYVRERQPDLVVVVRDAVSLHPSAATGDEV